MGMIDQLGNSTNLKHPATISTEKDIQLDTVKKLRKMKEKD